MIKSVLDGKIKSESASFCLEINARLKDGTLNMKVQDNAGGFSDSYIQSFQQMIGSKSYLSTALLGDDEVNFVSDKHGPVNLFFGGRGMGLRRFYAMVLDGTELSNSRVNVRKYNLPQCSTGIQICNRSDGTRGAIIEFFAPAQALLPHQSSSVVDVDLLPDLNNISAHRLWSVFTRRSDLANNSKTDAEDPLEAVRILFQ